jgi:hypothetical protein
LKFDLIQNIGKKTIVHEKGISEGRINDVIDEYETLLRHLGLVVTIDMSGPYPKILAMTGWNDRTVTLQIIKAFE